MITGKYMCTELKIGTVKLTVWWRPLESCPSKKNHLNSLAMGSVTWHFCQLSESESGKDLFSRSVISPLLK